MKTAIEIVEEKGFTINKTMSYSEAKEQAKKNQCSYLYDAGNGNVGRVSCNYHGRVSSAVSVDGKNWIDA